MYLHYLLTYSKKFHMKLLASIMGLDPDYNVLCKKSDSENIYIWDLERNWLPDLIDCFVFDKAMHEIPCIQFMTK